MVFKRHSAIDTKQSITQLISANRNGDTGAYDQLVALLYGDLRQLAHRQLSKYHGNATLQTTAVVNEAYLKLGNNHTDAVDRAHFLGIAAKAMRHVIIDYARKRLADKRGGGRRRVELEDSHLAVETQAEHLVLVDEALDQLSSVSDRLVRVFECKYFAELSDDETADALELSKRTVQREWMKARGLLGEMLELQAPYMAADRH